MLRESITATRAKLNSSNKSTYLYLMIAFLGRGLDKLIASGQLFNYSGQMVFD